MKLNFSRRDLCRVLSEWERLKYSVNATGCRKHFAYHSDHRSLGTKWRIIIRMYQQDQTFDYNTNESRNVPNVDDKAEL